jgi:hypothetical protein
MDAFDLQGLKKLSIAAFSQNVLFGSSIERRIVFDQLPVGVAGIWTVAVRMHDQRRFAPPGRRFLLIGATHDASPALDNNPRTKRRHGLAQREDARKVNGSQQCVSHAL